MKYTILVDNFCQHPQLLSEWGFAGFLEEGDQGLLLDTARTGHVLMHNLRHLAISPNHLGRLVLSHGHHDHCGGLDDVLWLRPDIEVWASPHVRADRLKGAQPDDATDIGGDVMRRVGGISPIEGKTRIMDHVWAFDIPAEARSDSFIYNHQLWEVLPDGVCRPDTFADDISLLVEGERGMSLVLGCAHAGLPNIMSYIHESFGITELYAVIGGTHMCHLDEKAITSWCSALSIVHVTLWRPNHCTGFAAAAHLSRIYDDVQWAGAGFSMDL